MDFVAIDFETASSENYSACSVGFAAVNNLEIVETKYYLIQPPTLMFKKQNIKIHGIKPSDVENSPKFNDIWQEISNYFDGSCPIIAHNARFDMSVLKCCLDYYNLPHPEFCYCDSIPISTKICTGEIPKKLSDRAKFFDIDMGIHHNALDDAVTCARIVIETIKRSRQKTFSSFVKVRSIELKDFASLNPSRNTGKALFDEIDFNEVIASEEINTESIFNGKKIVTTGEFQHYDRKEMLQKLVNLGATIQQGVNRQTEILIVGKQDRAVVGEDRLSVKEKKVRDLIDKGFEIQILTEAEFREAIKE